MNSTKRIATKLVGGVLIACLTGACAAKSATPAKPQVDVKTAEAAPEPQKFKPIQSASGKLIDAETAGDFVRAARLAKQEPLSTDDLGRIRTLLEKAVAKEPAFVEAQVNLGVTYERLGDNMHATALYQSAMTQVPGYLPACTRLARMEANTENPTKALNLLSPCIEQAKQGSKKDSGVMSEALVLQSRLKWQLGKEQETLQDLRKVASRYQDQAEGNVLRGDIHLAQREFMQAKALYERALADKKLKNPGRVYNNLAICEWNLKNYAAAVHAWETATEREPSLTEPYFHLGEMALQSGDYARAEEVYRKVRSIDSKNVSSSVLLGVALRGKGDFAGAEKAYLSALEMDGDRPEALFGLAVLYHKFMGRADAALRYYDRFAAVNPEQAKSKKIQELIGQARSEAMSKTAKTPTPTSGEKSL